MDLNYGAEILCIDFFAVAILALSLSLASKVRSLSSENQED